MSSKVSLILRKELLYFALSMTLVIVFNGLLSFIVIQSFYGDQLLPESGNAMAVLGKHIYWIIPLNILIVSYIMLAKEGITLKSFLLNSLKTALYFTLLTLLVNLLR